MEVLVVFEIEMDKKLKELQNAQRKNGLCTQEQVLHVSPFAHLESCKGQVICEGVNNEKKRVSIK